jgi:hypothetical protein
VTIAADPRGKALDEFSGAALERVYGAAARAADIARPRLSRQPIVKNATRKDPPWSQYFCRTLAAVIADVVVKYPRSRPAVVRAMLKAADFCAIPNRAAAAHRSPMAASPAIRLRAADAEREPAHGHWRDYAEDGERHAFYALRLHRIQA